MLDTIRYLLDTNKIGNCSERIFTEFGAPLLTVKKSPHPLLGSNLRPRDHAVSTLQPTMTVSVHAGVVDPLCSRQSEPKQQLRDLCVYVCVEILQRPSVVYRVHLARKKGEFYSSVFGSSPFPLLPSPTPHAHASFIKSVYKSNPRLL